MWFLFSYEFKYSSLSDHNERSNGVLNFRMCYIRVDVFLSCSSVFDLLTMQLKKKNPSGFKIHTFKLYFDRLEIFPKPVNLPCFYFRR